MQCGAIKFTLMVPMLLFACSEGADPIGPWAIDSTCSEGQEGLDGLVQCVGHWQGGFTWSWFYVGLRLMYWLSSANAPFKYLSGMLCDVHMHRLLLKHVPWKQANA